MPTAAAAPSSSIDLFTDTALEDPYPLYATLRETGAAVYLKRHDVWAIPRHADVRAALRNPHTFSSVNAIALTTQVNEEVLAGTVLASDGSDHHRLRKVLAAQLGRPAIQQLTDMVQDHADTLVTHAVQRGTFDATDLAQQFVADIVMHLMGLPRETRRTLITRAAATFDVFGPANQRYHQAAPHAAAMISYLTETVTRHNVQPGSWMAAVYAAADAGAINPSEAVPLMSAYTTAAIDTTILALTSAIHLLATHRDQWRHLRAGRADPEAAFHETLRLEAPVQGFGRRLTHTTRIADTTVDQGQQVWLLYGSAGRDPRHWTEDADRFLIQRPNTTDHLALGSGPHLCAGNHLATLEARALLGALTARCTRLELAGTPQRAVNNILRGWASLPITVIPDRRRKPRPATNAFLLGPSQ